ncbi:MAG: BglG family transcription antiterminator LicT [Enterococcus viikkiensis]|uniref:BglG family transcription antiterminator LicT n=1 Tax=Enterococcus viikkiensis TaxID=930854 RepID=UPI003F8F5B25
MLIDKIINNNVIFSKDDANKEIVIAGKGIAFQKKVGMIVDEGQIEKIFHIQDYPSNKNIDKLLAEIPVKVFEVTDQLIEFSKILLDKEISDSLLLSLSDHINTVLKRTKEGISIINPGVWEIKRYYHDEYLVGKKALELIEENFSVILPEDEAGFIAVYFINATMNSNSDEVYTVLRIIQEILTIIKYHFKRSFEEDSIYYYRFITHLKFFSQRLLSNEQPATNKHDSDLFEIIKEKYVNSYECVLKISQLLKEKYNYIVLKDEMLYLIIHIERLIYASDV